MYLKTTSSVTLISRSCL